SSVKLTEAQWKALEAQGGGAATANQAAIKTALVKLLGHDAADSDALNTDDIAKINGSLSTLPGIDANTYKPQAKDLATAGAFRKYLAQNDNAAAAFINQQK